MLTLLEKKRGIVSKSPVAEYTLILFADSTLVPLPPGTSHEPGYLLLSDNFLIDWSALSFSLFRPGDSVAIFGVGTASFMCVYFALLRGARTIYSIDHVPQRLRLAEKLGCVPLYFTQVDPVAEILARKPGGLDVQRSVDCVGYENLNAKPEREKSIVLK